MAELEDLLHIPNTTTGWMIQKWTSYWSEETTACKTCKRKKKIEKHKTEISPVELDIVAETDTVAFFYDPVHGRDMCHNKLMYMDKKFIYETEKACRAAIKKKAQMGTPIRA
jgi:hypothetical protein